MRVVWTRNAILDLVSIEQSIALDNPPAGAAMVEKLLARSERLSDHPESGRVVPEFQNDAIRELVVNRYRLVYHIAPDDIQILTVFEGHRLMPIAEPEG
jgi:toxin ParE1/3/4